MAVQLRCMYEITVIQMQQQCVVFTTRTAQRFDRSKGAFPVVQLLCWRFSRTCLICGSRALFSGAMESGQKQQDEVAVVSCFTTAGQIVWTFRCISDHQRFCFFTEKILRELQESDFRVRLFHVLTLSLDRYLYLLDLIQEQYTSLLIGGLSVGDNVNCMTAAGGWTHELFA